MKDRNLTVRVSPDLYQQVSDLAKAKCISNTQLMREAIQSHCDQMRSKGDQMRSGSDQANIGDKSQEQIEWLQKQLDMAASDRKTHAGIILELQAEKKALYDQIERQQQLHAMSEKRHEGEMDEIKGRSFLQRLKAVLVANP